MRQTLLPTLHPQNTIQGQKIKVPSKTPRFDEIDNCTMEGKTSGNGRSNEVCHGKKSGGCNKVCYNYKTGCSKQFTQSKLERESFVRKLKSCQIIGSILDRFVKPNQQSLGFNVLLKSVLDISSPKSCFYKVFLLI